MAPAQNPKGKKKVVREDDFIPMSFLNKHKIASKTVKMLKTSQKWNDVLTSTNKKSLLAEIQGLTDIMIDQICEAIDKKMVSLKSEVDVFTRKTVALLEQCSRNAEHEDIKRFLLKAKDCATDCYSFEEIHDRLHEEFGEDATKDMYKRCFASKTGHVAYKQMSSIRAAQRKAEQKEVGEEQEQKEKHPPAEKKEALSLEQKEERALEKRVEEALEEEKQAAAELKKQKELLLFSN